MIMRRKMQTVWNLMPKLNYYVEKIEKWSNSQMQELRAAANYWGKRAIADINAQLSR
jgi:hypothetical protein